jgi:hypothetical protein
MKEITLKITDNSIQIESPYDARLVDDIKALDKDLRKYIDGKWICKLEDPNQKPDEETNLEYLRKICQGCADRQSWIFSDYSAKSDRDIKAHQQQAAAENLEQHIVKFLLILEELPLGSLKLIRWGSTTLELQLENYLGEDEDGYNLFMRLKKASMDAFKPLALASFDFKMTRGFVFQVANDPRIVRKLLKVNARYLIDRSHLQISQVFDDGIAHFISSDKIRWTGVKIELYQTTENNYTAESWEICALDDSIYYVCDNQKIVGSFLGQSNYSVLGFGGSFRHIAPRDAELPKVIEELHLTQWFEKWAISLLGSNLEKGHRYKGFKIGDYDHPANNLIEYYSKFKQRSGLDPEQMQLAIDRIEAMKTIAANSAIAEAKATAIVDVVNLLDRYTRIELLAIAQKYNISVKKSAAKPAIIVSIGAAISQEVAENILNLDNL